MTPSEIVRNYREAKNKGEQVRILADLNVCSPYDIADLLVLNGYKRSDIKWRGMK